MAEPLVRIEHVFKKFVLHKDKSIKDRVLYWGSRSKSRSEFHALDDVSLEIGLGETVGLIGHNGSGKSTLLKVIGGIIEASRGDVFRRGRVAALLELGAGFHPDLSGRENVYLNAALLGMSRLRPTRSSTTSSSSPGIGGVHRLTGQVLLLGHVRPARVLRRRPLRIPTSCSSTRCSPSATSPSS